MPLRKLPRRVRSLTPMAYSGIDPTDLIRYKGYPDTVFSQDSSTLPGMVSSTDTITPPSLKYQKPGARKPGIPNFKGAANAIAPFASNIINSFRKPPKPPVPHVDNQITLNHVNFNNDRAQVERGIRGENANASKVLDENSAQAVRQQNLGVRATQLSGINQSEANTNVNIDNEAAKINAGIRAGNNYKMDNYDNAGVERTIAMQREASGNIANAADKYIGIGNERAKDDLELRKFGILSKTDTEGTLNRNFQDDPLYQAYQKKYGKLSSQRTGGRMPGRINPVVAARPLKPKHSIVKPFDTKRMLPVLK